MDREAASEAEIQKFKTPRRAGALAHVSALGDTRDPNSARTEAARGRWGPCDFASTAALGLGICGARCATVRRQAGNTPPHDRAREGLRKRKAPLPYLQVVQVHGRDLRVEEVFIGVELSDYIVHGRQRLFLIHCSCLGRASLATEARGQGQEGPPTSFLPISWEPLRSFRR